MIYCIVTLLLLGYSTKAQQSLDLFGKVTDTTGNALSHATISVMFEKDTIRTESRDNGIFILHHIMVSKIQLLITMKGYQNFISTYSLPKKTNNFTFPPIVLHLAFDDLDPVTVIKIKPIIFNGDTVSYHAASFHIRDGSETEDILKRLPGTEVDLQGNVFAQGKKISKVLVNGKPFFNDDLLLAIRNLPADLVEKIQIIDDYGDKSKLTGIKLGYPSKVLNIVLKPNSKNGEFGQIEGGIGTAGKYSADAFANSFLGVRQISFVGSVNNTSPSSLNTIKNAGLNYTDKWNDKWSPSINFNMGGQHSSTLGNSLQDNLYPNDHLRVSQDYYSESQGNTNSLSSTFTYKPSDYSTLRFAPSWVMSNSIYLGTNNSSTAEQSGSYSKATQGIIKSDGSTKVNTVSANLYYEHISAHSGHRFNITGEISHTKNTQFNNSHSQTTIHTGDSVFNSLSNYQINNADETWNSNASLNYFIPTASTSFYEVGYTIRLTNSVIYSNASNTSIPNGPLIPVDSLNYRNTLKLFSQIFHTGFTKHFKELDFALNLEFQPGMTRESITNTKQSYSFRYLSVTPNMQMTWSLSKSQKLNLNYAGIRNLPSVQQLIPSSNIINPSYPIIGNPNLKPSFTHSLIVSYEISSLRMSNPLAAGLTARINQTSNPIITAISQPKDSSQIIQQTTWVNSGNNVVQSIDYHLDPPRLLTKQLSINLSGNIASTNSPAMLNNRLYSVRSLTWSQSFHTQLLLANVLEAAIEGTYSVARTSYPESASPENSYKTANISFRTKAYIFKHWSVTTQANQPYNTNGAGIRHTPANLLATLQCQLLRRNQAAISLTGYNLLNNISGSSQVNSQFGYAQNSTTLIGTYFLLSISLKLNHFGNGN